MNEVTRPHTFRHESVIAQIIYVDVKGNPTGQLGEEETFIKIQGGWYAERVIKFGSLPMRIDQLKLKYPEDAGLVLNKQEPTEGSQP